MSRAERVLAQVRAQPLHVFLGVGEIEAGAGRAGFDVHMDDNAANPRGALHGGVIYTLCDVVCYAALLEQLADNEDAVTHDIHVSVMRAASAGETVRFSGQLIKRGRSLAFLEAHLHRGDTLLATARLTKSIIRSD